MSSRYQLPRWPASLTPSPPPGAFSGTMSRTLAPRFPVWLSGLGFAWLLSTAGVGATEHGQGPAASGPLAGDQSGCSQAGTPVS